MDNHDAGGHHLDLHPPLTCPVQPSSSYLSAYTAYRRRDNHAQVFACTLKQVEEDLSFMRCSKRCLSIGTGNGNHELEFINSLMPSLTNFTSVEPDAESAALLRANLLKKLPEVKSHVIQLPVEAWKGPDQKFDVILVFHFMYYLIDPGWRQQFCRQLFRWTEEGGAIVILMDIHDASPSGIHQLCKASNADRQIPTYDRTRSDLIQAGFNVFNESEFTYSRNWSNPDEDLLTFIQMVRNVQQSIPKRDSMEEIRMNMHRLGLDQITEGRTVLSVFQKPTVAGALEDSET